jgi:hypothetical protein
VPTRGGHTPSDLLHGRSYHVGDLTRPRRRTLGPASSLFRSGCSHTLPHPDQAGCTAHHRNAGSRGLRNNGTRRTSTARCLRWAASPRRGLPGCRAQMRRPRSTVGLWQRTFWCCGTRPAVRSSGRRPPAARWPRRSGGSPPPGAPSSHKPVGPARHPESRGSWTTSHRYRPPSDVAIGVAVGGSRASFGMTVRWSRVLRRREDQAGAPPQQPRRWEVPGVGNQPAGTGDAPLLLSPRHEMEGHDDPRG